MFQPGLRIAVALVTLALTGAAPPAPQFCTAARGDELTLFPLLDEALLIDSSQGQLVCDRTGCTPVPASSQVPAELALSDTYAVAGRWGHDVWMTLGRRESEGTSYRVVRYTGGRWRAAEKAERGWLPAYLNLVAAPDGRVAAITIFHVDGIHATTRQLEAGPPATFRLDQLAGPSTNLPRIHGNETPLALALLPHGQSAVLIDRVKDARGQPLVLRRGPSTNAEVSLPAPEGCTVDDLQLERLVASPDGVLFASGLASCAKGRLAYLARVEGTQASLLEVPGAKETIDGLAIEPDGTLWVVASGLLQARDPAGRWRKVELPTGCAPQQVEVRAAGDLFVTARCADGNQALHTACPSAPDAGAR